jgi:hypothetical protein
MQERLGVAVMDVEVTFVKLEGDPCPMSRYWFTEQLALTEK